MAGPNAARWIGAAFAALILVAPPAAAGGPANFPATLDSDCRDGRAKLFDECGDQFTHLDAGLRHAQETGKTLLVSYGAEWCIWCHVLHKYLAGEHGRFDYDFVLDDGYHLRTPLFERAGTDPAAGADALAHFASENFVLVHVENRFAPNGAAVLDRLGASEHFGGGLPFTFTVVDGHYGQTLHSSEFETRRDTDDWFRGYDRAALLAALRELRASSR